MNLFNHNLNIKPRPHYLVLGLYLGEINEMLVKKPMRTPGNNSSKTLSQIHHRTLWISLCAGKHHAIIRGEKMDVKGWMERNLLAKNH